MTSHTKAVKEPATTTKKKNSKEISDIHVVNGNTRKEPTIEFLQPEFAQPPHGDDKIKVVEMMVHWDARRGSLDVIRCVLLFSHWPGLFVSVSS